MAGKRSVTHIILILHLIAQEKKNWCDWLDQDEKVLLNFKAVHTQNP